MIVDTIRMMMMMTCMRSVVKPGVDLGIDCLTDWRVSDKSHVTSDKCCSVSLVTGGVPHPDISTG